jgi:hypothetical protein
MGDKQLQHLIISDIIRVAKELGKVPSRNEYISHPAAQFSQFNIVSNFGSWTTMMQASGLEYTRGKEKKNKQEICKRVFEKIKQEAEEKKSIVYPPQISSRHLFISDPHFPFQHPDFYDFLFALDDKHKFDRITCGGDEVDSHGFNFHDHDPDLLSPGHELEAAIKGLEPLWKRWPVMDMLESNHGSMAFRKAKHHGLPAHLIKSYNEILNAPAGVKWHEELVVQFSNGKKALVHHGYSPNILLASQKRAMSLIQFHFHSKFSIQYWKNIDDLFFAMQLSCMIDDTSRAFAYNKLGLERPIPGCGAVFDGLPKLLPMLLDARGRWTGVVP